MTEWINPRYAQVVAQLRQRQAAAPRERCRPCAGTGTASGAACRPCQGTGAAPAAVRMFVTG
jgi:DnaJ-class molecular chaperone